MSSFFNQLIDLGTEEKSGESSARAAASDAELSELNKEELLKVTLGLKAKEAQLNKEYGELKTESQSLRSEYDAYKQKVEGWQRQMRESRADDKRMIEQLRAASANNSGSTTDEVFAKAMEESIATHKEALREANDRVERAFKKQREAEAQRDELEASKKKEVDELWAKFDAFKERMKHSTNNSDPGSPTPSSNLGEGSGSEGVTPSHLEKLKARLSQTEGKLATAKSRNSALEEEISSLRAVIAEGRRGSRTEEVPADADGETSGSGGTSGGGASSAELAALQVDLASSKSQLATLQADLEVERDQVAQLQATESGLKEDLRRAEAAANRKIEDLEWEGVETEKKMAEVKLQLEASSARCSTLENRLEAKEAERSVQEKEFRRMIRDLEDSHEVERQKFEAAKQVQEEREQELRKEVSRAVDQAARTADLVGEAELASQEKNDALEGQRRQYEETIHVLERQLREADANRQRLEAIVADVRDDSRHREDVIDSLKQELDVATVRVADLEAQSSIQQKLLNSREDDLLLRERERTQLRQQLVEAEDTVTKLKTSSLAVEEERLDHRRAVAKLEGTLAEITLVKTKLEADAEGTHRKLLAHQRSVEVLEGRAKSLELELTDERRNHDDTKRKLEAAGATVAAAEAAGSTEVRIETEGLSGATPATSTATAVAPKPAVAYGAKTAIADPIAAASASFGPGGSRRRPYAAPHISFPGERDSSILVHLRRITWQQWKVIAPAIVLFLVILSLINSAGVAPVAKQIDIESMHALREKYEQAVASLAACRAMLPSAAPK